MAAEEMQLWLPPFISPLDDTFYERVVNFPDEFPYEFESFIPNHPLDSPVESISSATEAESSSDEEEFFASLTLINNSSPIHFPPPSMDLQEMKKWASAGSPQSVVGGFGDLSGRSSTSSNKSPTGRSHFPSPPTTCNADISTLDLINEVAGQVARLKINFEATKYAHNNCAVNFLRQCKSSCVSPPRKSGRISSLVQPNVTLPPNRIIQQIYSSIDQHQQAPCLHPLQLRSINDYVRLEKLFQANLKQQQEQIRQLERGIEYGVSRAQRTWSSPQPTPIPLHCRRLNHPPPFHCPPSSLSSLSFCNVKRESSGTGVFLPRGYGTPPPPRKKSEVVRAISTSNNINNNRVRAQLYGVLSSSNGPLQHEILLPQEWSY